MAGGQAAKKPKAANPGPGAHDVPAAFPGSPLGMRFQATVSFSVPKAGTQLKSPRDESEAEVSSAGPGQYQPNPDATARRSPGWVFGSHKRLMSEPPKSVRSIPAPDLDQGDISKSGPRYGFGSSLRVLQLPGVPDVGDAKDKKIRTLQTPGPGHVNPDDRKTSHVVAGPAFSFAPRRDPTDDLKTLNPGPGAYDITSTQNHQVAPKGRFSAAARMLMEKSPEKGSPGPGSYSVAATRTGHIPLGDSAPKWSMPPRKEVDPTTFA